MHEKTHVDLLLLLLLIHNQPIYFTLKSICYSPIKNKINKNHVLEETRQRHFPRPHLKPSQKHLWPQHLPMPREFLLKNYYGVPRYPRWYKTDNVCSLSSRKMNAKKRRQHFSNSCFSTSHSYKEASLIHFRIEFVTCAFLKPEI